ncbi:MAG TPA: hypothetical protein VHD32_16730 [Candidatus Didemnitutus sp.]|nr:hypothetical protein [Candidatus Didemnitutus sp.]
MVFAPSPEPRLAAPGAGLPQPELFIARLIFRLRAWQSSPEAAAATIAREQECIRALVNRHRATGAGQRALIPRLRGMEDSSRYWSLFMTVAHVAIVNRGIQATLDELLAGRTPGRVASTAAVKPPAGAGPSSIAELDQSCRDLLGLKKDIHRTRQRYAHPWFGPLDARDWYFLAGFHMALHRVQMERIEAGLAAEGTDGVEG